jgi:CheY-like chemotaxis protein
VSVVLVVEDEEQVRVLAESFLQGEGHKTLSAATTEQALVLLEGEEPIDLMFIDLAMQSDPEAGLKVAKKGAAPRSRSGNCRLTNNNCPVAGTDTRSWC